MDPRQHNISMHAKRSNMSNLNVKCINRRNRLIENVTKEVYLYCKVIFRALIRFLYVE